MSTIELILLSLGSLAKIANNPALGGGSALRTNEISEMLLMLTAFVTAGKEGHEDLEEFTAVVTQMAEENRGPRPDEFAGLRARSSSAHARLQAAKARAIAEDSGEEEDELVNELKDDLVVMAEEFGLEVPSNATKAEIIALIRERQGLVSMLRDDLITKAVGLGLEVPSDATKADIIELIVEHEAQQEE